MTKKSDAFADVVLFIESFDKQYGKEVPGLVDALTIALVEWVDPTMAAHRKKQTEEQTAD